MANILSGNTVTKPKVYPPAKPFFKDFYGAVDKAFTNGPSYNQGSMVTPYSQQSTDAFNGFQKLADNNSGGAGMSGGLQQILDNKGFSNRQVDALGDMRQAMNNQGLNNLANGNGFTNAQQRTMDDMTQSTGRNTDMLQNLINNGGYNAAQEKALHDAQGAYANSPLQDLLKSAGLTADQQLVQDRNRATMNSQFDLNSNPYFQQVQENMLKSAGQAVNGQAAAAGRYAGAANQSILGKRTGEIAATLGSNEYDDWKNRTDAAANNLFSGAQTGTTNQMNASSALDNMRNGIFSMGQQGVANKTGAANQINSLQTALLGAQQTGVNNKMNAVNQLSQLQGNYFNAANQGLANMGSAYQTALQPYQTQQEVGQKYEDLYSRNLADQERIRQAQDPYTQLQKYQGFMTGAPAGSSSTTNPSLLSTAGSIIGGGIGLNQLFGSLFGQPSTGGA